MLESAYATCLHRELTARKYRLDLLVEDAVVIEVKSIAEVLPIHQAQLLTYLRLVELPVGLVINFNVDQLVKGVKRVINPRWDKAAAVRLPP